MSPLSPVTHRRSSRRAPWTQAEAVHVLADAAASGLTLYSFGRKHGLGVTQLYRWRAQLAGTQPVPAPVPLAFVPVVAAEAVAVAAPMPFQDALDAAA